MKRRISGQVRKRFESDAEYYDRKGVLKELSSETIEISLNEDLRRAILSGKRRRRMRNISLKIDPLYILAIKKIATKQSIPYQTLVRTWLASHIRKELHLGESGAPDG